MSRVRTPSPAPNPPIRAWSDTQPEDSGDRIDRLTGVRPPPQRLSLVPAAIRRSRRASSREAGSAIWPCRAGSRVLTVPASGPSSTRRVKSSGVGYPALASRLHPKPWISTPIPLDGFMSLIEIVPRCPGSKPGIVAAVSLATDTITAVLERFSTSNENMTGPTTGSGPVLVVGTGVSTACEASWIVGSGVGAGEQAATITIRAASTSIFIARHLHPVDVVDGDDAQAWMVTSHATTGRTPTVRNVGPATVLAHRFPATNWTGSTRQPRSAPQQSDLGTFQAACRGFEPRLPLQIHSRFVAGSPSSRVRPMRGARGKARNCRPTSSPGSWPATRRPRPCGRLPRGRSLTRRSRCNDRIRC